MSKKVDFRNIVIRDINGHSSRHCADCIDFPFPLHLLFLLVSPRRSFAGFLVIVKM